MKLDPKVTLVAGLLFISFYPIFVKLADEPPIVAAFYRIFMGWLFLAPYCIKNRLLRIGRKEMWIAILAGVIFAADIMCWNMSMTKISATISTLIACCAPVWVGLISWLVLKKQSHWLFWAGTIMSIAGMVILVGYQHVLSLQINAGIWLALLTSIFYALYILVSKGVLRRINPVTFMFYSMIGAGIFLLAASLFNGNNVVHFKTSSWFYFIGMGVICQVFGWLSLSHALKHLPPTEVSITLLSQTVTTGLLAVWLLNETLEMNEVIGSGIVLAGIAITFLKPKKVFF
ncbi:MAG: DMT family transporter [Mucilaginibacter sp.]